MKRKDIVSHLKEVADYSLFCGGEFVGRINKQEERIDLRFPSIVLSTALAYAAELVDDKDIDLDALKKPSDLFYRIMYTSSDFFLKEKNDKLPDCSDANGK